MRLDMPQSPRQLHGDGAAAIAPLARRRRERGANQRHGIESVMPGKMAIFIELHAFDQLRRNRLQRRPQPILIVGGGGQSEKTMVASIDRRRRLHALAQSGMRREKKSDFDDTEDPGGDIKSPTPPGYPRGFRHR